MWQTDFPSVDRLGAFRDSLSMSNNAIQVFDKYHKKLGSSYYFPFGGIKKALVTTDPSISHHILQTNYKNYKKSDIQNNKMGSFLGNGLLTSHGDYWLTQRRIIQEGFKKDKLKSYLKDMEHTLDRNLHRINALELTNFDLSYFLSHVTFEMVMSSLFTQKISEPELAQITNTIKTVQKYILDQIIKPYRTPFTKISGEYNRHQKNRIESDRVILNIIRNREQRPHDITDMLDILLQAKYSETGTGMTEEQLLMESMQLIVAGHETSSTSLMWTIYLLTQHPKVYLKVKEELDSFSEITMQNLMGMTTSLQVIQESLRAYPPFWMIDREAIADDEIFGHRIKRGTMILIYIYGIHHSEKYWHLPYRFDPDRFSGKISKKKTSITYLPFGTGPKGCIGGNYAMLQMLLILKKLLSDFDLSMNKSIVTLEPLIMLKPKQKMLFNLRARI